MDTLKIFGPPGTGKTHRLLALFEAELAAGTPPERIAYLTFTVAARAVAKERALATLGVSAARLPYVRTLHSLAHKTLGVTRGGLVIGVDELSAFGTEHGYVFKRRGEDASWDAREAGDALLAFDHFRRHTLQSVDDALTHWPDTRFSRWEVIHFTEAYAAWKQREGMLDFTDLLETSTKPVDVDVIFVDEAQDLSRLQWATLRRFAATARRMIIAGDDDQAIFAWAGASPEAFREIQGAAEVLGQSYRVPRIVQAFAGTITDRIVTRQPKDWRARDADGVIRFAGRLDPSMLEGDGTGLVLYRQRYQAAAIEEMCRVEGVPYAIGDRPAPGSEWGPAIVAWEEYRHGRPITRVQYDALIDGALTSPAARTVAKAWIKTWPTTQVVMPIPGLPQRDLPWYRALTRVPDRELQYLRRIVQRGGKKVLLEPAPLRLSTIHGAKGAEADRVVLITELSRRVRRGAERTPDAERRVWYVGATRAREELTVVGFTPLP